MHVSDHIYECRLEAHDLMVVCNDLTALCGALMALELTQRQRNRLSQIIKPLTDGPLSTELTVGSVEEVEEGEPLRCWMAVGVPPQMLKARDELRVLVEEVRRKQ